MHDRSTDERILAAVTVGDIQILKCFNKHELVNARDASGATCLHYAARCGHLPIMDYLVNECHLAVDTRSCVGATAGHDAAASGNKATLDWLLSNTQCSLSDRDEYGVMAVHLAACYGHLRMLKWIVIEEGGDVEPRTKCAARPLHFAAASGHLECVKFLVENRPGYVDVQMQSGATPAYLASQEGHLETLRYLVEEGGASVKILAYDGMSCLHAAAQMGHMSCVQWLVKMQDLSMDNRDFDGTTPLHLAAGRGHVRVVRWLLKKGVIIRTDNLGGTALHEAAQAGHSECARELLEHGCDVTVVDCDELTAGELAERCGHPVCATIIKRWMDTNENREECSRGNMQAQSTCGKDSVQNSPYNESIQHESDLAVSVHHESGLTKHKTRTSAETGEILHCSSLEFSPLSKTITIPPPPTTPAPPVPFSINRSPVNVTGSPVKDSPFRNSSHESAAIHQHNKLTNNSGSHVAYSPRLTESNTEDDYYEGINSEYISLEHTPFEIAQAKFTSIESAPPKRAILKSICSNYTPTALTPPSVSMTTGSNATPLEQDFADQPSSDTACLDSVVTDSMDYTYLESEEGGISKSADLQSDESTDSDGHEYKFIMHNSVSAPFSLQHAPPSEVSVMKRSTSCYADVAPPAPPPPPPPVPPSIGRSNNTASSQAGGSEDGERGSERSYFVRPLHQPSKLALSPLGSRDLIAELKAVNGRASLKRVSSTESGASLFFGAKGPAIRNTGKPLDGKKEKPKLTKEYDPKKFLDQVPPRDTAGNELPVWKRHIVARQIAEKAQRESEEKQMIANIVLKRQSRNQKDQEDRRWRNVPEWKKAILQKRDVDLQPSND